MSLFDAPAPTPVELKGSTTQTAPQYLTDYLTQLATTGQGLMDQGTIAPLNQNLQDLYGGARGTLNRYQAPMDQSLQTLQDAAQGVSGEDISRFYNPYEQDVVNEMGRQSALNVQQSMLPALRAAFAGQGAFGSQRFANATGQAMGNVQADLFGNQAKLRSEGYKSALDAALRDRGYDIQAGQSLGSLGAQESQAGVSGVKALGDIGTQELGYEQSKIEAPLTRAQNVAQIMRGYTYPTTTNEAKEVLPGSYAPSALQQIAGLGTLVGASFNSKGTGIGDRLVNFIGSKIGGSDSVGSDGVNVGGVNPISGEYMGSLEFARGGLVKRN